MSMIEAAQRVKDLPPYLFLAIDRAKREARQKGADIIDFGIGDPDQPTPRFVIRAFNEALKDKTTHQYPLDAGRPEFRQSVARWFKGRFGVDLDPDKEILPLIGSKEGLTHMALALVNPGDRVLVPDPGYPAYERGVSFAGGESVRFALREERGFLPDWDQIGGMNLDRVRLAYLNYPNNPTGAVADKKTFEACVNFARKRGVMICHDNAYSEIYYDGKPPASFLESPGAKDVGVEFHSLSKTFNMTGWRLGFACGNAAMIAALAKIKSNMDSGVFSAIQLAGATALDAGEAFIRKNAALYQKRRDLLVAGLKKLGWRVFVPQGAFYVWCPVPPGRGSSMEFAERLLGEMAIVATPGNGFGSCGEGYVRFALCVPERRIREALKRLKELKP